MSKLEVTTKSTKIVASTIGPMGDTTEKWKEFQQIELFMLSTALGMYDEDRYSYLIGLLKFCGFPVGSDGRKEYNYHEDRDLLLLLIRQAVVLMPRFNDILTDLEIIVSYSDDNYRLYTIFHEHGRCGSASTTTGNL